jgi:hypothetical protein
VLNSIGPELQKDVTNLLMAVNAKNLLAKTIQGGLLQRHKIRDVTSLKGVFKNKR